MQENDINSKTPDHYEDHAESIKDLSTNPQKLLEMGSQSQLLQNSFPQIAASMTSHMTNAVNFLDSKLPKPNSELPLSPEWKPSVSQKDKFNRYFHILNDPIEVLSHVKNGTLSNEHMEALQTVYPELLGEMRQKVMSYMDPKKTAGLAPSTKIALSKFLGTPLSSNVMPSVVMANQAAFAANNATQQAKQEKSSVSGLSKLKVSELAKTRTQRLDKEDV